MPAHLKWDAEEGFQYWYNAGHRRTWTAVADHLGVHMNTIRHRAKLDDWQGRSEALDKQVRERTDRELAKQSVRANAEIVAVADAVISRFARRLLPTIPDGNGGMIDNPAYLRPEDVSVDDAMKMAKLRMLASGGATTRVGTADPEREPTLDEIDRELEAMSLEQIEAENLARARTQERVVSVGEAVVVRQLEPGEA